MVGDTVRDFFRDAIVFCMMQLIFIALARYIGRGYQGWWRMASWLIAKQKRIVQMPTQRHLHEVFVLLSLSCISSLAIQRPFPLPFPGGVGRCDRGMSRKSV